MESHGNALPQGYRLLWYRVSRVLGQGGFGITYEAFDTNLETPVAIKEYLPKEFAVREQDSTVRPFTEDRKRMFEWGMDRFLQEARTLAKFHHHNIVRVHNVFQENGTAYMVMDYEQGESLDRLFKLGRLGGEKDLMRILMPLLDGVEHMHEAGFIHRDIKPANIYVRMDGTPVLLDFGSARFAIGGETKTLTSLVTPGFAPFEQYNPEGTKQGPWTDIYGIGATLYAGINRGRGPIEAIIRGTAHIEGKSDPLESATEKGKGHYSESFLQAIDAALGFRPDERPQSVGEWKKLFTVVKRQDTQPPKQLRSRTQTSTFIRGSESAPEESKDHRLAAWAFRALVIIGLVIVGSYMLYIWRPAEVPQVVEDYPAETQDVQEQQIAQETLKQQQEARLAQEEELRKQQEEQAQLAREEEARKVKLEQERIAAQVAEEQVRLQQERARLKIEEETRQKAERIDGLLAKAEQAIGATRLTSPKGNNAMEYLRAALEIDSNNLEARHGIGRVVSRYIELAEAAVSDKQWNLAKRYIGKAEMIEPGTEAVVLTKEKLKQEQQKYDEAEKSKLAQLEAQRVQERSISKGKDKSIARVPKSQDKLPIALAVYGVTPNGSVDKVSGRMKLGFRRTLAEMKVYEQVDIKLDVVDKAFFSDKVYSQKGNIYCDRNPVSMIFGICFDHGMGGSTGDFAVAAFDCATEKYTKNTYIIEYDFVKSSWGKSMRDAVKTFFRETNILNDVIKKYGTDGSVDNYKSMSKTEIISMFSGKTISGEHIKKKFSFSRYYAPDGTLYEQSSRSSPRMGKWSAKEGMLCEEFQDFGCHKIVKDGNVIRKYDTGGILSVNYNHFTDGKSF
jgi:serine/threonine protein kinase